MAETETEIRHPGTNFSYKVVKKVRVPTLKIDEDGEYFVKCLEGIQTKSTPSKGEDGVVRMKEIDTLRIVDLTTGAVQDVVVGAALKSTLLDFNGGNGQYIGCCFRIVKRKAAAGKRFKNYEVDQIEVPNE